MGNKSRMKNITSTSNPAGNQLVKFFFSNLFIFVWLRRSLAVPSFPLWLIPGGLDVITTYRSTVIGYTSQGTHQLIFPTALCSHPCVLQSVKPHAALQPANIIRLCLHSFLKTLVCSQHRTDELAAGVVPCWASRYIIMLHEETHHVSSWSHQKKKENS